MKTLCLVFFVSIVALIQPAFSQDKPALFSDNITPIQIGKESHARIYLKDSFLNAAISRSYKGNRPFVQMLPIEQYMAPNTSAQDFFDKSVLEHHYPWLFPLIYPSFIPTNDLIFHKWVKPITISFGYPNDFKPYEEIELEGRRPARIAIEPEGYRKPEIKTWISEQLQKDIPSLISASGLSMEFIPKDQEDLNNPANVRIVIVSSDAFGGEKYKNKDLIRIGEGQYPIEMVEDALPNVAFTPNIDTQLSGYFVQNKKGEIQFSVCKINEDHPKEIIQKLVRECLVRSLGFPSLTGAVPSILSSWNNPVWKEKDVSSNSDGSISDLDLLFIKTLYDESISAGETIADIL